MKIKVEEMDLRSPLWSAFQNRGGIQASGSYPWDLLLPFLDEEYGQNFQKNPGLSISNSNGPNRPGTYAMFSSLENEVGLDGFSRMGPNNQRVIGNALRDGFLEFFGGSRVDE